MIKQQRIRNSLYVICAALSFYVCPAAASENTGMESETITDTAMGTDCSVRVYGSQGTAREIMDMLSEIEVTYLSWRKEGSDLYTLNQRGAGKDGWKPEQWTYGYLEKVLELSEKSGGAFDPTLGAVSALWNLGTDSPYIPKKAEIDKLLENTGWENIRMEDKTVYLDSGVQLDLGAVGKGIGCDEARKLLEKTDAQAAVVAVGGSIQLYGEKADQKPWKVGITNPRKEDGEAYLGILTLDGTCSVSTSGDYEKYVIEDGIRYHHILNPETGYPADSGLISVTIVSEDGWLGDGLSTACFVLGYEKSKELLEEYGAEAVFVTADKDVLVTDGLKEAFELTDEAYQLKEETNEREKAAK